MKNQVLELHAKLKIGNQESWESHTSQKCHMDGNPVNEWRQVGQVGWIGLGGEFHFKGEIYSTLHILGFNFYFFGFEIHYVRDFQKCISNRWILF